MQLSLSLYLTFFSITFIASNLKKDRSIISIGKAFDQNFSETSSKVFKKNKNRKIFVIIIITRYLVFFLITFITSNLKKEVSVDNIDWKRLRSKPFRNFIKSFQEK